MCNIYYVLWADTLTSIKRNNPSGWKTLSFIYITLLNALNFAVVQMNLYMWFGIRIPAIKVPVVFSSRSLNGLWGFFIEMALPFIILNYLIIFRKNRCEQIMKRYNEHKNGKLFAFYLIISVALFVITIAIYAFNKGIE